MKKDDGFTDSHEALEQVLKHARAWLKAQQISGTHWDFHAYLGVHFVSQYYLCLKWLAVEESDVDTAEITKRILDTQLPDGSWHQVEDIAMNSGEINATIFNYWYLKVIGTPEDAAVMKSARHFILESGGIEKSALFTKTFLALFNQYSWQKLSRIPYLFFHESMPSNYKSFSQWVIPHLMPIAYLRAKTVAKDLGPRFSLRELWKKAPAECKVVVREPNRFADLPFMKKMISMQQPRGSWGGYTASTLFTLMAIQHFRTRNLMDEHRLELSFRRGLKFSDGLYVHAGKSSYLGCLMDGHYWDTLLCANALVEAGEPLSELVKTRDYILATQTATGGFPYGFDFEYAPDVDDTAEAMLLCAAWGAESAQIQKSAKWLVELQNEDGGWGAFDRNNVGNPLLKLMTRSYKDSVALFDDSSADSTAHVLDALAAAGLTMSNSPTCQKAVDYLLRTQDPSNGGWSGRWAINYIFGTTCAIVGLIKTGLQPSDPRIKKAVDFLLRNQNPDGGFGESTLSYVNRSDIGRGPSTASQTAWVLWALSHSGLADSREATRAASYLCSHFYFNKAAKGWVDVSVTGTGHPGLLYMVYPSYAAAFPLIALGTYARKRNWVTKQN